MLVAYHIEHMFTYATRGLHTKGALFFSQFDKYNNHVQFVRSRISAAGLVHFVHIYHIQYTTYRTQKIHSTSKHQRIHICRLRARTHTHISCVCRSCASVVVSLCARLSSRLTRVWITGKTVTRITGFSVSFAVNKNQ